MTNGDPNLQVVADKPVPAPDNILHQFTNYTYKISLLSFKTVQNYNDLAEKGSWDWAHANIPKICYTLFSSGGILNDGSEILPARHPKFELDFYIESMTTSGLMGMNSNSRATNLMDLSMAVVEPTGTTLLDRFHEVLTEDGGNWTEKPLLVQIDFLGYDEEGKNVRIKPATRWIPVRIANLDFNITAEGTNYSLEFIMMAVLEADNNPITQSLNLKTIKGKQIQDIFKHLEKEFNREQTDRTTGSFTAGIKPNEAGTWAPKTQEFADSIEFRIGTGGGPAANRLKSAKISPNVAKQTLLKVVPSGHETVARGERGRQTPPKEKFKNDSALRYYGERSDYKIEISAPGQSMLSLVEKVIRDSTYITDQLADNKPLGKVSEAKEVLKDPNKGLDWFKITYVKILKEFDNIRNKYARHTLIQIDPYKVVDPEVTGGKAKPGQNGVRNVARSYDYIYSGQNLDIRNLDLTFNNSFILAMAGVATGNASADQAIIPEEESNVAPDAGNRQDQQSKVAGGQNIKPKSKKFIQDPHATSKQRTGATLMENLYRTPGSDMMSVTMEIVGDPGYIQQDGVLSMATPNKTGAGGGTNGHDPKNGAILCDLDDAHFYLLFKTPRDYDEATGLADFSSSAGGSTLSGYYRVWEVNSVFQGGEFTQTIEATRIYNQWRENIDNPEKNTELMSNDEANNYDFEDAKAAANQLITPGSAEVANEATVGLDAFGGTGVAPTPMDADEFAGTPLTVKEEMKNRQLTAEAIEVNNEFAGIEGPFPVTETSSSKNFVNPHADFNTAALQNRPQTAAEFRASEASRFGSPSIAQSSGTLASELSTTGSELTPIRPNPADASGPVTFSNSSPAEPYRSSPSFSAGGPVEQYRSSPSFVTTTGGTVLPTPQGNPVGTVALDRHPNISTYETSDQTTVANNDTIMGVERQTIINAGLAAGAGVLAVASLHPAGRIIRAGVAAAAAVLSGTQLAHAWERGNSASEKNEVIHNKYGNNVPSWKKTGYLLDIISEKESTTTGGGGGF